MREKKSIRLRPEDVIDTSIIASRSDPGELARARPLLKEKSDKSAPFPRTSSERLARGTAGAATRVRGGARVQAAPDPPPPPAIGNSRGQGKSGRGGLYIRRLSAWARRRAERRVAFGADEFIFNFCRGTCCAVRHTRIPGLIFRGRPFLPFNLRALFLRDGAVRVWAGDVDKIRTRISLT